MLKNFENCKTAKKEFNQQMACSKYLQNKELKIFF